MASGKTTLWSNTLLDWEMGGTAVNLPGTTWWGLWTSTLTAASAGTAAGEVSGGGYARYAAARNSTNFAASAGGTISNAPQFSFGTASADWGTVTHIGGCWAATSGTLAYFAQLTSSKIIQNGDPVVIAVGDLKVTEA